MRRRLICLSLLAVLGTWTARGASRAKCIGSTVASLESGTSGNVLTTDPDAFVFKTRTGSVRIPYSKVQLVEYGQEVNRRILLGWAVSPVFLLSKARGHYVTLHFTDDGGKQQAVVLRVDKQGIRSLLATLEARTGRKVEYQDGEARKYRK